MNSTELSVRHRSMETDLGIFTIAQRGDGALASRWLLAGEAPPRGWERDESLLPAVFEQLRAYFAGGAFDFDDVPTPEGSRFHQRCWDACRCIPLGETRSYAELAVMAGGTAAASRAAGQAMRHNPLPVIVPCHRVIGAGGRLHGFGGTTDPRSPALDLKRRLLAHERACSAAPRALQAPMAVAS